MCKQLKQCMLDATPEEKRILEEMKKNARLFQDPEVFELLNTNVIQDVYGKNGVQRLHLVRR